jgi:hypothetical protein
MISKRSTLTLHNYSEGTHIEMLRQSVMHVSQSLGADPETGRSSRYSPSSTHTWRRLQYEGSRRAMTATLEAAIRLHRYIDTNHGRGGAIVGPDPGVRWNYRVGRFVKSYLPFIHWTDHYYYLQAQGYWALANWRLYQITGDAAFHSLGSACAREILAQQRPDGAWSYPNPEWRGRVATAEGIWAAIGLLESYRNTRDVDFLQGALRWHAFLDSHIGYQRDGDALAINYFAGRGSARVPNNAIFVLRFLSDLADASGDQRILDPSEGLLTFVKAAQRPSGEFPYAVAGPEDAGRPHFQCFQYNAFQCLDLLAYYQMTGNEAVLTLAQGTLKFLARGLREDGSARYDCGHHPRTVLYHTAALGAAFAEAARLGIHGYEGLAARAYGHLLAHQREDGRFPHSRRDYRLFQDNRSYPRYLAMILYHLLLPVATDPASVKKEGAPLEAR